MFGGSGGIVVVSSCLDGPKVHRPADSAWMEARVDSRQATGAGTTKLAATDVPGGARPGRVPHCSKFKSSKFIIRARYRDEIINSNKSKVPGLHNHSKVIEPSL